MLSERLTKKFAKARRADMEFSLGNSKKSFSMSFSGYNEKMEAFVDDVLKDFKAFQDFDEVTFGELKAEFKKSFQYGLTKPEHLCKEFLTEVIREDFLHDLEHYNTIDVLSFENFQKFVPKFFRKMKVQVLMQGNVTKAQALNFIEILKENIACESLDDVYDHKLKTTMAKHILCIFIKFLLILKNKNLYQKMISC
jgi:secreted Zn-dependent insulinase-like peptidase